MVKWVRASIGIIICFSILCGVFNFSSQYVNAPNNLNQEILAAAAQSPVLSNGVVTPFSGNTTETYKYSVTYTDWENYAPASVTVVIDSEAPVKMTAKIGQDGDYRNGEIYEYTNLGALVPGNHTYQFSANNGVYDAVGEIGSHNGPLVNSSPSDGGGSSGSGESEDRIFLIQNMTGAPGVFTSEFNAKSYDGLFRLTFPKGIKAQTADGGVLSFITITPVLQPPIAQLKPELSAPEGADLIGLPYELKPDGVSFTPAIIATMLYKENGIPPGISEKDLFIASWDTENKKWIALERFDVDTDQNTVTALLHHFSVYAILGNQPEPVPAKFSQSDLIIKPLEALPGQEVNITTTITNTGGSAGVCNVQLKINGVAENHFEISLDPGISQTVVFTLARKKVGGYLVDVNGKGGNFWIKEPTVIVSPIPEKTTLSPEPVPTSSSVPEPGKTANLPESMVSPAWIFSIVIVTLIVVFVILLLRQKSS